MKLKYNFVIRKIDDTAIAIAVEQDAARFNGMIKLNETGELIFQLLLNETTVREIADQLAVQYGITLEQATQETLSYIQRLRGEGLIVE